MGCVHSLAKFDYGGFCISLIIIIPRPLALFNGQTTLLYLGVNKTFLTILFLLACIIISGNALRSIIESYGVGSIYQERKRQTEKQYLEVIKKKNELDYINSPFFVEKQLRESLNYYRKGEKLLVFTEQPVETVQSVKKQAIEPFTAWLELLRNGITNPLDE